MYPAAGPVHTHKSTIAHTNPAHEGMEYLTIGLSFQSAAPGKSRSAYNQTQNICVVTIPEAGHSVKVFCSRGGINIIRNMKKTI